MRARLLILTAAISVACAADDDGDMNTSIAAGSTSGSVTEGSTGAPEGSSGPGPQGSSSGGADTSADTSTGAPEGDSTGATTGDPSGGSETGTEASPECVQYCDEFMLYCNELPDIEAYDDLGDCMQTCASFAHGPVGAFDGDTVECRIAHLTFEPKPGRGYYELHCFHAQEHPTAQCV